MLWLKAFHVIFVVTWFAGLFYLPRLFVYHTTCDDAVSSARFKIMERRLLAITTIGGSAAVAFGLALLPWWTTVTATGALWLHLKLVCVAALMAFHVYLAIAVRRFAADSNTHSERFYRLINEIPALLLVVIVILVVVKPL